MAAAEAILASPQHFFCYIYLHCGLKGWEEGGLDTEQGDRGLDGTTAIGGGQRWEGGGGVTRRSTFNGDFSRKGVGRGGDARPAYTLKPRRCDFLRLYVEVAARNLSLLFLYILTSFIAAKRPLRFEMMNHGVFVCTVGGRS